MHRTQRGWLAAVLLALGVGIASAQAPDGPPPGPPPNDGGGSPAMADHAPGPQRELKTLTKLLSLTTDQQAGVKAILEEQSAAMRVLRAKSQSSSPEDSNTPEARQARMAEVEQIRDESNTMRATPRSARCSTTARRRRLLIGEQSARPRWNAAGRAKAMALRRLRPMVASLQRNNNALLKPTA